MACAALSIGAQTGGAAPPPRNAERAVAASEQDEIRRFIKEWEQATLKADKDRYERHYADSFIKTGQRGDIGDKRNQIVLQ